MIGAFLRSKAIAEYLSWGTPATFVQLVAPSALTYTPASLAAYSILPETLKTRALIVAPGGRPFCCCFQLVPPSALTNTPILASPAYTFCALLGSTAKERICACCNVPACQVPEAKTPTEGAQAERMKSKDANSHNERRKEN